MLSSSLMRSEADAGPVIDQDLSLAGACDPAQPRGESANPTAGRRLCSGGESLASAPMASPCLQGARERPARMIRAALRPGWPETRSTAYPRAASRPSSRSGRPLRVKLGIDPDGAGHPPRLHRRPAEAPRVPGPRPHGGADHRRLHRAGRATPAAARARGPCSSRRRSTPTPGPSRPGAEGPRHRAAGGPLQRRVARHAGWRSCSRCCGPRRWPGSSSAMTSTSATRAGEPISILELLYPLLAGL